MRTANKIITTAFMSSGLPATERIKQINYLSWEARDGTIVDRAVSDSSPSFVALLGGQDPRETADQILAARQQTSREILTREGNNRLRVSTGLASELAINGLFWWKIATDPDFARYVRLTSFPEDASTEHGLKNGVDIIMRTDNRRHQIQVKSQDTIAQREIDRYEGDIIVISPPTILGSPQATSMELHDAIVHDDRKLLEYAISGVVLELRTQKATNGYREVI